MTSENTDTVSESTMKRQPSSSDDADHQQTTVLVRGETVQPAAPQDSQSKDRNSQAKDKDKAAPPQLNDANVGLRARLPALDDDADVGVQKDHIVTRDGKPDLAFVGTLLASAAPSSAPKGEWQEYRLFETTAGKHVFSKIGRNVNADQEDTHEAEVFDPAPSSVPSKLMKSARDLTHSRQKTWADAAADFFGYDPLAKDLYRKLGGQFEEHIG